MKLFSSFVATTTTVLLAVGDAAETENVRIEMLSDTTTDFDHTVATTVLSANQEVAMTTTEAMFITSPTEAATESPDFECFELHTNMGRSFWGSNVVDNLESITSSKLCQV